VPASDRLVTSRAVGLKGAEPLREPASSGGALVAGTADIEPQGLRRRRRAGKGFGRFQTSCFFASPAAISKSAALSTASADV
jgi:hypothetical protein